MSPVHLRLALLLLREVRGYRLHRTLAFGGSSVSTEFTVIGCPNQSGKSQKPVAESHSNNSSPLVSLPGSRPAGQSVPLMRCTERTAFHGPDPEVGNFARPFHATARGRQAEVLAQSAFRPAPGAQPLRCRIPEAEPAGAKRARGTLALA